VTTSRPVAFATRYAGLFGVQLRMATLAAMQYRVDFVARGFIAFLWSALTLIPLLVVFGVRQQVAGWSFAEALVVVAWFMLLRAVLEGAVSPSLTAVVEHVRKGTLDFVLLKPADAQFLVSTARFEIMNFVDVLAAVGLAAWALGRLHHLPSPTELGTALLLTLAAAALLYALAILVISAAFYVVRLDNLIYLFNSVFDAARWPASVFRGVWRILFTFVVPLALMTTYPALALLGRLAPLTTVAALGGAGVFFLLSRVVWRRAIGHYRSASS
jgi:ABC-2 type transport system permease protein